LVIACGPSADLDDPDPTTTTTSTASTDAVPVTTTTSGPPPGDDSDVGDAESSSGPPGGFIQRTDGFSDAWPCNPFEQDCPRGQKCTIWANDGGPAWNASRCVDIDPDPVGVGETCTVVESGVSGLDDCDLGLICWYVDDTGQGECIEFCRGTADAPTCPPMHQCTISSAGVVSVCVQQCDPLLQDCPGNFACYPVNDGYTCAQDGSGRTGSHGDPCDAVTDCDPGLFCIDPDAHSTCNGAFGCCSTVCDLSDPMADATCAALDPAQSCQSWYFLPGMAPRGYEDVGVCALPGR
jgi:hypothetical protein